MFLETFDIRNGKHNSEIVWICDYRYDDYSNKPIRNIPPTQVLIRSNTETNKRIYYSESHFVALNKKGEPVKSKVIALFDNTGFRTRTGTAVHCFTTQEECNTFYKNQLRYAIKGLVKYRDSLTSHIDNKITELTSLL